MNERVYTVFGPFGGGGFGLHGFQNARVTLLGIAGRFEVVGGIDFDADACRDFELMTGVPEWCADVDTITVLEIRRRFPKAPHCVFLSPPCKAASKLLSDAKAQEEKYKKMMRLALVWTQKMLEAWADDLPPLVLFENVPNITTARRGREIVAGVRKMLRGAGYVTHDGFHDCGTLGGLAQHRKRFLMVARLPKKIPPLLYQPPIKRVRGCGEVLGDLPLPEDTARGGVMHTMPRISWLNWIRLSLIPPGGDWRDIPGVLEDGQARRTLFRRYRLEDWSSPVATIGGSGSNGPYGIADPRVDDAKKREWFGGVLGVNRWTDPMGVIASRSTPSNGSFSVADPRTEEAAKRFSNVDRVTPWTEPTQTITSSPAPSSGSPAVADPRVRVAFDRGYSVLGWCEPSPTVAGGSAVGQGAYSVADPRLQCEPHAGAYGVLDWQEPSKTVTAHHKIDNAPAAVADHRFRDAEGVEDFDIGDPKKAPSEVPLIIAADGTWHRPLTTLELAALQGIPTRLNGQPLVLTGSGATKWRETIGNAVPPPAAQAIAERMLVNLISAEMTSFLPHGGGGVWVETNDSIEPGWVQVGHA